MIADCVGCVSSHRFSFGPDAVSGNLALLTHTGTETDDQDRTYWKNSITDPSVTVTKLNESDDIVFTRSVAVADFLATNAVKYAPIPNLTFNNSDANSNSAALAAAYGEMNANFTLGQIFHNERLAPGSSMALTIWSQSFESFINAFALDQYLNDRFNANDYVIGRFTGSVELDGPVIYQSKVGQIVPVCLENLSTC